MSGCRRHFPPMFEAIMGSASPGAIEQGAAIRSGIRARSVPTGSNVDDRPYGGGPGMVLQAPPLAAAIQAARREQGGAGRVLYLSPQGRRLDQTVVRELAARTGLILLAGRYEGVDERLLQNEVDEEWSIGDYVLSGGELAAMVLIDAVVRQLPGALGDEQSAQQDSFATGLLSTPLHPPECYGGRRFRGTVVRRPRAHPALAPEAVNGRTWLRRPELLTQQVG